MPDAILLGARRCKLNGVLTATLLYRRGETPLTLFVPGANSPALQVAQRFAGHGLRCLSGSLGEGICAGEVDGHGAIAVAELDASSLSDLLQRTR